MNGLTTQPSDQACEIRGWERFKMRYTHKLQRWVSTALFGKHTQWFYRKYLGEEGPLVGIGDTFNRHWYSLSEAFWCHICGSHDLALEYFLRTFAPNYKSKKWRN